MEGGRREMRMELFFFFWLPPQGRGGGERERGGRETTVGNDNRKVERKSIRWHKVQ